MEVFTNVDFEHDLEFMDLEVELKTKNHTPEELIEMYKPLAEEQKRYEDIQERTRAERIKKYGEYGPNNECYKEFNIELAEIWQKENHYGGKAGINNIKCDEIAYKYKKLTGRDIKEDL